MKYNMVNEPGNGDTLHAILGVLQSIEKKLDVHERRLIALQSSPKISTTKSTTQEPRGTIDGENVEPNLAPYLTLKISPPSSPVTSEDVEQSPNVKVPYTDIGFSAQELANSPSSKFQVTLEHHLGDCARLPDDRRLPLNFFNGPQDWTNNTWAPHYDTSFNLVAATQSAVDHLVQFDTELRSSPGNDFLIIDYDAAHNSRLYRIGEAAIGSEIKVDLKGSSHKQWSRLM